MAATPSFADLAARLGNEDEEAARIIVGRFTQRLLALARSRMGPRLRSKVDPEDLVQSVFKSFFAPREEGKFRLTDWNSLWGLLSTITLRKCYNRDRLHRAASRDVRREVPLLPSQGAGEAFQQRALPSPAEEEALAKELFERLLGELEERNQTILLLWMQGHECKTIAEQMGRSPRLVQLVMQRIEHRLRQWIEEEGPE